MLAKTVLFVPQTSLETFLIFLKAILEHSPREHVALACPVVLAVYHLAHSRETLAPDGFPACMAQTVIQRAYNASAVRVIDEQSDDSSHGEVQKAEKRELIPVEDPSCEDEPVAGDRMGGQLCIEMRICLYDDGTMSKLLEQLAKVGIGSSRPWNGLSLVAAAHPSRRQSKSTENFSVSSERDASTLEEQCPRTIP